MSSIASEVTVAMVWIILVFKEALVYWETLDYPL